MIIKKRTIPLRIEINEALLRRLSAQHQKRTEIEIDLKRRAKGLRGEQSLDYYLNFLPTKDNFIFHDLRIPYMGQFFQMDTLLINKYFILILESKNFGGILFFDQKHKQLIRTYNDQEEGFSDPISQVKRHRYLLKQWIQHHFQITVPIECLVIISNPSTIIKSEKGQDVHKVVTHIEHILEQISIFENKYTSELLEEKILKKCIRLLLKQHTPKEIDISTIYQISKSSIQTGVQCPSCCHIPMIRKNARWECPSCKTKSKDAHIQAIYDYFLTISPTINNRECRDFLHLSSEKLSYKLLSSMNLSHNGKTKGRIYYRPMDINNKNRASISRL